MISKVDIQFISDIATKRLQKTPRVHFELRTLHREKVSVWVTQICVICLTIFIFENVDKQKLIMLCSINNSYKGYLFVISNDFVSLIQVG